MLEAGQARRLFTRSDRPSVPKLTSQAAEERVMLDDPAIAVRRWRYEDEPAPEARDAGTPDEARDEGPEPADGERAMHAHDQMCKQYVHGEPCVLGAGHAGDHTRRCRSGEYGEHGLPCALPDGHGGDHQPMSVDDGDGKRGPGRPRMRDGEDTADAAAQESRTLTGPEALIAVMQLRGKLASVD